MDDNKNHGKYYYQVNPSINKFNNSDNKKINFLKCIYLENIKNYNHEIDKILDIRILSHKNINRELEEINNRISLLNYELIKIDIDINKFDSFDNQNDVKNNIKNNDSDKNPIWYFPSFHDRLIKPADLFFIKKFKSNNLEEIKYKKTVLRKETLNLLNIKNRKIKKNRIDKKKISDKIYNLNEEIKLLKGEIFNNRFQILEEDYSIIKNEINISKLDYQTICFLDSKYNTELISKLKSFIDKIQNLYIEKEVILEKENKFMNPSIKFTKINKNNLKYQKILIINKENHMNFIYLLNTRLLNNLIDYQKQIKNNIEDLESQKESNLLKIKKLQNEEITKSKVVQFYQKKIKKIELKFTNIFQ